MTARNRLPNHRPNQTIELDWQGQCIAASIGYDPATGRPAEVFARLAKPGSELDLLLDDLAIALSLLLQLGMTPEKISHSVGREHGKPASVIALLADTLAKEGEAYG